MHITRGVRYIQIYASEYFKIKHLFSEKSMQVNISHYKYLCNLNEQYVMYWKILISAHIIIMYLKYLYLNIFKNVHTFLK